MLVQKSIIGECKIGSTKQLGCFSREDILSDSLIEECPFFELTEQDMSSFSEYAFYDVDGESKVVPAGNGCFYNHSDSPNAAFSFKENGLTFTALEPIKKGDQIFVDYGEEYKDFFKTP